MCGQFRRGVSIAMKFWSFRNSSSVADSIQVEVSSFGCRFFVGEKQDRSGTSLILQCLTSAAGTAHWCGWINVLTEAGSVTQVWRGVTIGLSARTEISLEDRESVLRLQNLFEKVAFPLLQRTPIGPAAWSALVLSPARRPSRTPKALGRHLLLEYYKENGREQTPRPHPVNCPSLAVPNLDVMLPDGRLTAGG